VIFLCIYWRFIIAFLENSEIFFLILFLKKQPYYVSCGASNWRNSVDTTSHRFSCLNRRGDDFFHIDCLIDVIFNISWVNVSSGPEDKDLSKPMINVIFLLVEDLSWWRRQLRSGSWRYISVFTFSILIGNSDWVSILVLDCDVNFLSPFYNREPRATSFNGRSREIAKSTWF